MDLQKFTLPNGNTLMLDLESIVYYHQRTNQIDDETMIHCKGVSPVAVKITMSELNELMGLQPDGSRHRSSMYDVA